MDSRSQQFKFIYRRNASIALGKLGDTRAVGLLIQALKDEHLRARADAVHALGELKDARAIEPLKSALDDEYLRWDAKEALTKLGWQPP